MDMQKIKLAMEVLHEEVFNHFNAVLASFAGYMNQGDDYERMRPGAGFDRYLGALNHCFQDAAAAIDSAERIAAINKTKAVLEKTIMSGKREIYQRQERLNALQIVKENLEMVIQIHLNNLAPEQGRAAASQQKPLL